MDGKIILFTQAASAAGLLYNAELSRAAAVVLVKSVRVGVGLGDLLADFIGELWTYQKLKELATGITGKVAGYVKSAE